MRLQDRVAFISSAQHPCAKAIALGFAREGAHCIVGDQDPGHAEKLAAEIRSLGRRSLALQFDVTKKSSVEETVRRAVGEFGHIDVLLNCSGVTRENDFLSFTEEAFNDCIERGPKAYFLMAQAVGRQMAEQRSGKIINLSTTDARVASGESTGNSVAYSSIDAMTRAIAQALGFYGVNVNSLVCGPLGENTLTREEIGERMRRMPIGRLAKPEDLVGAAVFLATGDSNFVSGESLFVDAGYSNAAVTEDGFRPAWGKVWGSFEIPSKKSS
jgi:NAD(P)-dependent dehydrogenase (short-subunit alcohol dehydrogenase family)